MKFDWSDFQGLFSRGIYAHVWLISLCLITTLLGYASYNNGLKSRLFVMGILFCAIESITLIKAFSSQSGRNELFSVQDPAPGLLRWLVYSIPLLGGIAIYLNW